MLGQGTHGQSAVTITDDTDLALCIALHLVDQEAFDGQDITNRFYEWYENGPFDVGLMTADALHAYDSSASWRGVGREVWKDRQASTPEPQRNALRTARDCLRR